MDVVIRNGLVVTPGGVHRTDVGIRGEKIAALGAGLTGRQVLDANGCYVLPGLVDAHVHLQMAVGDLETGDDFFSGTVAAACGGTTSVIDFTENVRGEDLTAACEKRRRQADGQAAVDYALHLTLPDASPRTLRQLSALACQGYASAKIYTTYENLRVDDAEMLRLLAGCQACGVLPMVHVENDAAIQFLTAQLLSAGKSAPRYHPMSRPPVVEADAAQRALSLAFIVCAPLYLAHVSCRETLLAMSAARERGQRVFGETCPHYLLLSQEDYDRPGFEGAKFVLSPPLRDRANWDTLWQAVLDGQLQVVSTDHCPWSYAKQKVRGQDDFSRIPNGAPGIETRGLLLFGEGVAKGRLPVERFAALCSTEPAKLFGLYPRKGVIAVGSDADLVVLDPAVETVLSAASLHQRVDYCPYEGWRERGALRAVLLRGQKIVEGRQYVGRAGAGRFIPGQCGAWS